MAISSINIQQSKLFSVLHNDRASTVSYLIDSPEKNETNSNYTQAINLYSKLLSEATSNYYTRTGQKIQTDEKKFIWEAVVNLNKEHTLADVTRLAEELNKKYGWQIIHLSLHRDEGHIDAGNNKIRNLHAQIVLFMLDKNGIYRFKKRDFGIRKMEELQTWVAEVLRMKRGTSKKKTHRVRMEHRQYRQHVREIMQYKFKINNLIDEMRWDDNLYFSLMDEASQEINSLNRELSELREWKEKKEKLWRRLVEEGAIEPKYLFQKFDEDTQVPIPSNYPVNKPNM